VYETGTTEKITGLVCDRRLAIPDDTMRWDVARWWWVVERRSSRLRVRCQDGDDSVASWSGSWRSLFGDDQEDSPLVYGSQFMREQAPACLGGDSVSARSSPAKLLSMWQGCCYGKRVASRLRPGAGHQQYPIGTVQSFVTRPEPS